MDGVARFERSVVSTERRRFRELAWAAMLGVALAWAPGGPAPAAAVDPCASSNCATLSVVTSGTSVGSGRVTDDLGQIDCTLTGGATSGTCTTQYIWSKFTATLEFTLTLAPAADSYGCWDTVSYCRDIVGATFPRVIDLTNGSNQTVEALAQAAYFAAIHVVPGGDGDGRVTTTPAGLDCRIHAGLAAGTCDHTFYYEPPQTTITFSLDPGAASFACWTEVTKTCGEVGQALTHGFTSLSGGHLDAFVTFAKGHPILTVDRSGKGSVTSSPAGISCPSSCASYFPPDTAVTLTATPRSGYVLSGWTGACRGARATCTVKLGTTDASTTAVFMLPATPPPSPVATTSVSTDPAVSPASSFGPPGSTPPTADSSGGPAPSPADSLATSTAAPEPSSPTGTTGVGTTTAGGPDVVLLGAAALLLLVLVLIVGFTVGRRSRASSMR